MIRLSRILKDYEESGALNARVNVTAAIDEHTLLTKCGDLVMMLRLKGVDYECLDAPQLDHVARRFEAALRTFDDHYRIYQYVLKRDHASIPTRAYDNPVVRQAALSRIAFLNENPQNLYSLEIYFAVVYEGLKSGVASSTLSDLIQHPLATLRQRLSTESRTAIFEQHLDRAREIMAHKVMNFVTQLPEALGAEILDKHQAFCFLHRLLNYAPYKSDGVRLKYDDFVDYQACDSALECHRDHLRLDDFYVSVLTLKEPPSRTFAHLLRVFWRSPATSSSSANGSARATKRCFPGFSLSAGTFTI